MERLMAMAPSQPLSDGSTATVCQCAMCGRYSLGIDPTCSAAAYDKLSDLGARI